MEDGLTGRVLEQMAGYTDPLTEKLRPSEIAGVFRAVAAQLEVSWPAVALRVPAALMPSRERIAEAYQHKRPPLCMGCTFEDCPDCRRSEVELGRFTREQLLDTLAMATVLSLDYTDTRRELRRRQIRGIE